MKKKVTVIILTIAILVTGALLLASCTKKNTAENTPADQKASEIFSESVVTETQSATSDAAEEKMTPDRALDIALSAAGIGRDNAVVKETPRLDSDDAVPHYEIEFIADGFEYDYEIGLDGKVLDSEKEKADADEISSEKTEIQNESKSAPEKTNEAVSDAGKNGVSAEEAKAIALKHAGLSENEVVFEKTRLDNDEYISHYDIEFRKGNIEYDYEINARTGAVMDFEKDAERAGKASKADTSSYIGKAKAEEIALNHAGFSAKNVKGLRSELDTDDLIAHYSVEFKNGKYEYDYEINASSGKIMGVEKEIDR